MQILNLRIRNFKGIREFNESFDESKIVCLVGRGDSCKTTIIQAIYFALCPQRWIQIEDHDFHKGNIEEPIQIEVTIGNFTKSLFKELYKDNVYGDYLHKWDKETKSSTEIWDEHSDESDEDKSCLKIQFYVDKNLEPIWQVLSSNGKDSRIIHASDRAKFNAFFVEDYQDKHFTLSKGSPLINLYRNKSDTFKDDIVLQEIVREIQNRINNKTSDIFDGEFIKFCTELKTGLAQYNVNLAGDINPSIVARSFHTNNTNFLLGDDHGPLHAKGKGTKRLSSIAIQSQLANNITLIDEVEQGLEPDRVKALINKLGKNVKIENSPIGQIFLTTHSRDVVVEFPCTDIYIVRNNKGTVSCLQIKQKHQGAVRKNPEALFGKKILVCEGPTEVGFIRALENYLNAKGEDKLSYLGIVSADGGGKSSSKYASSFIDLGYDTCLFCDSDDKEMNADKVILKALGAEIVDWNNSLCVEDVVANELPWNRVVNILKLISEFWGEESVYDAINDGQIAPLDRDFLKWVESKELRQSIGAKMNKKKWLKSHTGGEDIGNIVFNSFNDMSPESQLKVKTEQLLTWARK